MRREILATFAAEGIEVIDTLPALRRALLEGQQLYPASENGHPNACGYSVIAESVRQSLGSW